MRKTASCPIPSNVLKECCNLFFSIAFVIAFNRYFFENFLLGNESIINFFLLAAAYLILHFSVFVCDRHLIPKCTIFSLFLSTTLIVGRLLYYRGNLDNLFFPAYEFLLNLISIAGFSAVFSVILSVVIQYIVKFGSLLNSAPPATLFRHPWICGILIFLSWVPCYLAYYPGIFAYDMVEETNQAFGYVPVTRFHPPLHVYFWRFCLFVQKNYSVNALTIYAVVQMLLLSFSFSYVIYFLAKRNINNKIILLSLLFFCLNPVIAVFSFNPAKDAMAAAFFTVYTVELFMFLSNKKTYANSIFCNIRLIISGILCCLLRNNFIYALILSVIFMIPFLKKWWKQLLLWGTCILLGYCLVNGPVYNALGVRKGDVREMLSVPIQQIAYTVQKNKDTISQDMLDEIDMYLPCDKLPELYNPRFADPTKQEFNSSYFENNSLSFIKLWFKLFCEYPKEYVVSFLNLNLPYWYSDACTYDVYSERKYIETGISTDNVMFINERDSKLPQLYSVYQALTNYKTYQNLPFVSNFFSISTPIWLLLFVLFFLKTQEKFSAALPFFPAVFVWFTYLLGPVSNFRYIFPIYTLYPLLVVAVLQPRKVLSENT